MLWATDGGGVVCCDLMYQGGMPLMARSLSFSEDKGWDMGRGMMVGLEGEEERGRRTVIKLQSE